MRASPEEESNDSIYTNNNILSSVTHTLHTLHKKEKRSPRSIRLRPSAYSFISNYARMTRMLVGEVVEEACLFYIDQYPVDGNLFIIENTRKTAEQRNIHDTVKEIICVDDLETFIENAEERIDNGLKVHQSKVKDLAKILRECEKIKHKSEKLETLMVKAVSYVAQSNI